MGSPVRTGLGRTPAGSVVTFGADPRVARGSLLDIHAAQGGDTHRPGQHVRDLHVRGVAVTVTHGPRELADFLDQPAEGTVFAPLAVAGTIDHLDPLLELVQVHRNLPGHESVESVGSKTSCCARCHRSEEHTSELQSLAYLVCRLLLEK